MSCSFDTDEIRSELEAVDHELSSLREQMWRRDDVPEHLRDEYERLQQKRDDLNDLLQSRIA